MSTVCGGRVSMPAMGCTASSDSRAPCADSGVSTHAGAATSDKTDTATTGADSGAAMPDMADTSTTGVDFGAAMSDMADTVNTGAESGATMSDMADTATSGVDSGAAMSDMADTDGSVGLAVGYAAKALRRRGDDSRRCHSVPPRARPVSPKPTAPSPVAKLSSASARRRSTSPSE